MTVDFEPIAQEISERYRQLAQCAGAPIRTPLLRSDYFSQLVGGDVYLKHEQLQTTGSFKYRGAFTKINSLSAAEKAAGVVAASSGNHGMAVAKAAKQSGVAARVYVPSTASELKKEQIVAFGAEIHSVNGDCLVAETQARNFAKESGQTFISPYNDKSVLMGQGGIGIELIEQLGAFDSVLVSVGGGGLIGGIGAALECDDRTRDVELVGCWPENAPILHACLQAGEVIDVAETPTLSDATAGNLERNTITYPICDALIDTRILVSEAQIISAMQAALMYEGVMIEGAAAVALAALVKERARFANKKTVVVLCGRNITYDTYVRVIG